MKKILLSFMLLGFICNNSFSQSQFSFVEKYGFGTSNGGAPKANITSLIEFKGKMYVTAGGDTGQVYCSATGDPGTFTKVYNAPDYNTIKLLTKTNDGPTGGYLFAVVESDYWNTSKVIRSSDGINWQDYYYCSNSDERIQTLTMFKGTGTVDSVYFVVNNSWAGQTLVYRGGIDANDPSNGSSSFALLTDIWSQFGNGGVSDALVYGDTLFFTSGESVRLFKTRNGSLFEENLAFNTVTLSNNYSFSALAEFNGEMYYGSQNGNTGAQIWKSSDGANFTFVKSFGVDTATRIIKMYGSGNKLWLLMRDNYSGLFIYSLNAAGVASMENDNEFGNLSIDPQYGNGIVEFGNHVYIGASVYYWGGGGKRETAHGNNQINNYTLPAYGAQIWRTCLTGTLPLVTIPGDGDTLVCRGSSVTLTANPGMTSYMWSTLSTNQTISVTQEGYYVVSGYNASGCANAAEFILNNIDVPMANAYDSLTGNYISGLTVCEGDTSATVKFTTGADAYAFYVPGQNQGMVTPVSAAFTDRQITIEMWIKPVGGNSGAILNEVDPTNVWQSNHHDVLEYYNGVLYVELPGINEINVGSVPADQWSHIALRFDGSTLSGFINGVDPGYTSGGVWQLPDPGVDAFEIGQNVANGGYGVTDNKVAFMRDIRIWNSARTNQDIFDNMNGLPAGSYPDLIYYYKMNEGSGTVAHDSSGNGNDAAVTGYFVTPDVITITPAAGVTALGGNYFNFSPDQTTTYAITYSSSTGCAVDTNFFTVDVPKISFAGSTPAVCGGNDAYLYIAPAGSYTWTPSVTQYTTNLFVPSPQPTSATWYYASGFSSNGCPLSDSILVNVGPSFSSIVGNPPPITACQNSDVLIDADATGGTAPYTYLWNTPQGIDTTYTDSLLYNVGAGLGGISLTAVDAIGCGFYMTYSVTVTPSTDLHGHISMPPSMTNVDNGFVYVFKYQPGGAGFDTVGYRSLDANGDYLFAPLDAGNYMIKVLPDETSFPLGVPTYYGNAFQWDSSIVYTHGCTQIDTANINLVVMDGTTGTASISGYIIEGPGFGTGRYNGSGNQPNLPFVPGGPLKGIDVKLGKNPGGGIQARTMSDSTGFYMFDSVPDGGYKIYVDIPNLPMDSTRELIVASGDSSIQNNYFADSVFIYINPDTINPVGIYSSAKQWENNFVIYPNPGRGTLYLAYTLQKQDFVSFEVRNAMGQLVKAEPGRKYPEGKNIFVFDTVRFNMQGGVYFISILTGNKKYTQRVVIID